MSAKPGSRKKVEEAQEALAMLDKVDMAFLAVDPSLRVSYANRMAAEFFGRPEGSLVGVSLHDLLEACLPQTGVFDKFYDRVLTTGKAGEQEVPVHNFRWALFHLYPVGGGMAIVVEDVTHRHIRDEPQRAALLTFNSLPEAVFLVYENGGIYYANNAACKATGYTREELKMLRASEIIPDLDPWVLKHNGEPAPENFRFESVLWPKAREAVPVEVCISAQTLFRKTNFIVSVRDITERKRAQEELVWLEEKTRDLLNRAPTGIYELDFRGPRFVSVNDFVCEATGYTREELMAMSPFDLLADESKALFQERIQRQLAGDQVDDTVEYRGMVKDGREMYWSLRVTFTYDGDGQPKGAIVVGNDITERRRAEGNAELLRALVDQTPSLVFLKDESGRYVYLNSAYEKQYALSRDWYGKTDFDFWPRESAELFRANDARVIESGQMHQYLEDSIDIQGNRHCWLVHKFPYIDMQGHRYIGGIGTDVIDRVQAEEALLESEKKFRRIIENTNDGIINVDKDWRITFANQQMSNMLGYPVEELLGKRGGDLVDPTWLAEGEERFRQRMIGLSQRYEMKYRKKDGSVLWTLSYGTPLFDRAGNFAGSTSFHVDITDRKLTEEALRESEEKYKALVETLQDFTWAVDLRGKFTYCSPQMKALWGYEPEMMIGKTPFDQAPPEVQEQNVRFYEALAQNPKPFIRQDRALDARGNAIFIEVRGVPFFDPAGKLLGYRGTTRDITERRRAEEALRESEKKFRALTENISAAILILGRGGIEYVNDFMVKNSGYSREELSRMSIVDVVHPDARAFVMERYQNWLRNGMREEYKYELKALSKGGDVHWLDATLKPIVFEGRPAVLFSGVDVTERKRAEEALQESEVRYRELIKQAPVGIYEIDFRTKRFLSLNDTMCVISGYSRDELLQMNPSDLLDDRSKAAFQARLASLLSGNKPEESVEYTVITKDGRKISALLNMQFAVDEAGKPKGATVIATDITDRKRAEEALTDAKQQAELYLDLMGHDINNMHQIALGYLELARDRMPHDDDKREFLDKPIEVMQRSAQLIKNVRKLQKHREGMFHTQEVDVCGVLWDVRREFGSVPHKAITLNLNGYDQCHVRANELLQDVFANLISNAIKHTGDTADISLGLDLVTENGGRFCRVSVEDDGPGIPDDFKARIFNRMLKGTNHSKGMGLGLYLVKSLVDSYGGRVWVEDRVPGDHTKGARFVVMLPAVETANQ